MEYIKFNKNFIFQSIFRYLHKFLCFHAGNNRSNPAPGGTPCLYGTHVIYQKAAVR